VPEIYVSTDIEADGPIPGPYSMLSLGSAAFLENRTMVGTYAVNLETLPEAESHPKTMVWWKTQPLAWAAARTDPQPPEAAMKDYVRWVKGLPGKPVFVAYPAGYDFTFVYWYLIRFAGESPFSHSALDIKTLAMPLLGRGYRDAVKQAMPREWFEPGRHTHVALDDAIEQGKLFCNILAAARARTKTQSR
jgi:hypothetical protein